MSKRLIIDASKCTGCGMCQMACAFTKTGHLQSSLSRIKVWRDEPRGLLVPMVCQHCDDPPCAQVCLMNLIHKDQAAGITIRAAENCIDCRLCQVACPFEGCNYDYLQNAVVNCDLCGGTPQCVRFCAFGAIQYTDPEELLEAKRAGEAGRVAK